MKESPGALLMRARRSVRRAAPRNVHEGKAVPPPAPTPARMEPMPLTPAHTEKAVAPMPARTEKVSAPIIAPAPTAPLRHGALDDLMRSHDRMRTRHLKP